MLTGEEGRAESPPSSFFSFIFSFFACNLEAKSIVHSLPLPPMYLRQPRIDLLPYSSSALGLHACWAWAVGSYLDQAVGPNKTVTNSSACLSNQRVRTKERCKVKNHPPIPPQQPCMVAKALSHYPTRYTGHAFASLKDTNKGIARARECHMAWTMHNGALRPFETLLLRLLRLKIVFRK